MSEEIAAPSEPVAQEAGDKPTHIVGVGASAGGLEALAEFFQRLSPGCGAAFVVVQHLSPDFNSLMDEILARHTTLRIHRAEDGQRITRDGIYLLQPRKNIVLRDGCISLIDQEPRHGLNLPIDVFFNSLARDAGDRAIAVVLSGTGSDGSRGIRAVKEVGGMVMVQDETTAKFDGMPRAAIATGLADFVLSPTELADQLLRFVTLPGLGENQLSRQLLKETTKLDQIVRILLTAQRSDFSLYKPATLSRRIERRMGLNHLSDLDKYILLLRESEAESAALAKDLLIGVTRFFRDFDVWELIKRVVLPKILADTPQNEPLRFWSPACSTGEEAYSLAMLVEECFAEFGTRREVKVFATDVDPHAVESASEGRYAEIIAADVGPRRLSQFFLKRGGHYEVARPLREMVVSARHDLLRDPPFTKLHLISCRNFLIYVQPAAQQRVISLLHFALRPTGYMVLGGSETPGDLHAAFKPVDEKLRVYQRDPTQIIPVVRHHAELDMAARLRAPISHPDSSGRQALDTPSRRAFDYIARTYCPPAILVSPSFELLHTFGDVSDYLRTPPGAFTAEVSKTAVEDVRIALMTALHRASKSGESVSYRDVRVRVGGELRVINLRAEPLPATAQEQKLLLVVFEEQRREVVAASVEFHADEQKDSRIRDLEFELQQTRESLQATIEELETSNEELQSTNEELLASNEELQSTNEELHSVNEELYTVNAEYQSKINELTRLTNDFDNLLRSTELGTVFVDRHQRIRRFTPAVCDVINLLDHDIGRPVQQFNSSLRGVNLGARVAAVIESAAFHEEEVQTEAGAWYLMRLLPFITQRNEIDGAVLTLVPIDRLKASEQARRNSEVFLHATLDSLSSEIAILDEHGRIIYVNRAWREFARLNGWGAQEAGVGMNYLDACDRAAPGGEPDDARGPSELVAGIRAVLTGELPELVTEYPCHSPTEQRWFAMRARPFAGPGPRRVVVEHQDITPRKLAELALRHETGERVRSEQAALRSATQLASIVDSALDSIITIDRNGRIKTLNSAVQRMFGYTPDELIGHNVSMLMPSPYREQHDAYIGRYLQTGERRIIGISRELTARHKNGRIFPVHLSVSEFQLGEERFFTGVLRDMTEQAERLEALRRTADALQATNRDLEQFATIAAHDLHEPLRTIRGYCQLLRDRLEGRVETDTMGQFQRVEAAVEHLQGQIDALRRYSQIGPSELERRSAPIERVVENALASLESSLISAKAQVVRGEMPELPVNPELLEQVFQNLIDNAVKYRGESPPQIVLNSEQKDEEWVFSVGDNGIGIRPEHRERIFQMFKRINPPAGSVGAGVGLAIAKRIVDKHGGRIWVESNPGAGSTFYFSLPSKRQRQIDVSGAERSGSARMGDRGQPG